MTLKLTDRLRGKYVMPISDGCGPLDGKDTFTRHFYTPPIQNEAADVIDALREALFRISTEARIAGFDCAPGWDAWLSMSDEAIAKADADGAP
jgi:hypothetical protein